MALAEEYGRTILSDRGLELEAQVLEVLFRLHTEGKELAVKAITDAFQERYGEEYGGRVSPRWIGSLLRKRLNLKPRKQHGVFVVPPSEFPKLSYLFERYGLGDIGDVGDVSGGGEPSSTPLF